MQHKITSRERETERWMLVHASVETPIPNADVALVDLLDTIVRERNLVVDVVALWFGIS